MVEGTVLFCAENSVCLITELFTLMPSNKKPLEIAVVGSGLAGLSVANLLSREHHVTILERASTVGMDLASVSVSDSDGKEVRIDSPMRGWYHLLH